MKARALLSKAGLLLIFAGIAYSLYYMAFYHLLPFMREKPIVLGAVYVVNLDRSKERYATIKEDLDRLGIKHTRFSAVDGYNLNIEDDAGKRFKGVDLKSGNHSIDPKKLYTVLCPSKTLIHWPTSEINGENFILTAGEYGCYCSHLGVWKEMIDRKIDYALILEDDASFAPGSLNKLNKVLRHAPNDFDIIYLHILGGHPLRYSHYLKRVTGGLASTAAYILSLDGAKKLFKEVNSTVLPIDLAMSKAVEGSVVKAYVSRKRFVTAKNGTSNPESSVIAEMHFGDRAQKNK